MSDRRSPATGRTSRHLILGAIAAGLGLALLRTPYRARYREEVDAAPELIRSAVIDGVLMRWEEHGGPERGAIPVVMVHGIPTNPASGAISFPD